MKHLSTRLLLILLALSTVFGLCACNTKQGEADTTEPSGENATGAFGEWLPNKQYGTADTPQQVVLLTFAGYNTNYHLVSYEENGEALNEAAVKRTLFINEQFNVDLLCEENNKLQQTLEQSQLAGGGEYDLYYPHLESALPTMIVGGAMTDLASYEYLHLDQPWWSQNQVQNYTVNGKLYIAVSDFSLSGQSFTTVIYNREIYNSLVFEGKEDLYKTVKDGNWTMEKLGELTMLYGNVDEANPENSTYGLIFPDYQTNSFLYAMDEKIAKLNETTGQYELALNKTRVNDVAQKLYNLVFQSEDHIFREYKNFGQYPTSNLWSIFKSGNALFSVFALGRFYSLLYEEGAPADIGYLPMPKFDTAQTNYRISSASGFLAIPDKASDPEMSSVVLEALAIHSYNNYRPTYFNTILQGRMSEHEEDYDMLEFLHSSKQYDLGYTFDSNGEVVNMLYNVVIASQKTNVSGYIEGNAHAFNAIFEKINNIK